MNGRIMNTTSDVTKLVKQLKKEENKDPLTVVVNRSGAGGRATLLVKMFNELPAKTQLQADFKLPTLGDMFKKMAGSSSPNITANRSATAIPMIQPPTPRGIVPPPATTNMASSSSLNIPMQAAPGLTPAGGGAQPGLVSPAIPRRNSFNPSVQRRGSIAMSRRGSNAGMLGMPRPTVMEATPRTIHGMLAAPEGLDAQPAPPSAPQPPEGSISLTLPTPRE